MTSPIGAVITERNILTPLHLFVVTMPILKAVASGNGNLGVLEGNYTFKFKIIPDRHNAGQKLINCLLPDPPHFSLQFCALKITFFFIFLRKPAIFILK
jgi:hypothetical protein